MIPFVCGGYLSFVHLHIILLQEMAPDLSRENSSHGSDASWHLLTGPSLCHTVWSGSGYWTQTALVTALCHLAMTVCQRVCR